MSNEEKIFALQIILQDIRGNWGYGLHTRVGAALELATDLTKCNDNFHMLRNSILEYSDNCQKGHDDGRWFRQEFPCGYDGMQDLHSQTPTYQDKSLEFKDIVKCLSHPDLWLEDVEDNDWYKIEQPV